MYKTTRKLTQTQRKGSMLKFLALFFLVGLAWGQPPKSPCPQCPCCSDITWEGLEGLQIGTDTEGTGSLTEGQAKLAYDNDAEKVYMVLDTVTDGGPTVHVKYLQDFKKKVQYVVKDKKCEKMPTPYPFLPSCVPEGSKKVTSYYYGSPTSPLYVDVYMIPPGTIFGLGGYLTVTSDGCIPVGEGLHGKIGKTSEMISVGFSNYTKGVKDPSVFDPPPECKNVTFNPLAKDPIHRYRRSVFH